METSLKMQELLYTLHKIDITLYQIVLQENYRKRNIMVVTLSDVSWRKKVVIIVADELVHIAFVSNNNNPSLISI